MLSAEGVRIQPGIFVFSGLQGERLSGQTTVPKMKELWGSWHTRIITPCVFVVRALGVLLSWGWGFWGWGVQKCLPCCFSGRFCGALLVCICPRQAGKRGSEAHGVKLIRASALLAEMLAGL